MSSAEIRAKRLSQLLGLEPQIIVEPGSARRSFVLDNYGEFFHVDVLTLR